MPDNFRLLTAADPNPYSRNGPTASGSPASPHTRLTKGPFQGGPVRRDVRRDVVRRDVRRDVATFVTFTPSRVAVEGCRR